MAFELPKLPYKLDELAPVIEKQTMEFHYGKHHQTYVTNLNNLVAGTPFENASLEQIIKEAEGPVFNNGAQVWNHTFYFETFRPQAIQEPTGRLAALINKNFGSLAGFKELFSKAAIGLFGSGWAWLVLDSGDKLEIVSEGNAGNPLRRGLKPLLTCDVWEHAYYLGYQNRRPDYVKAFWQIVDWAVVEKRL